MPKRRITINVEVDEEIAESLEKKGVLNDPDLFATFISEVIRVPRSIYVLRDLSYEIGHTLTSTEGYLTILRIQLESSLNEKQQKHIDTVVKNLKWLHEIARSYQIYIAIELGVDIKFHRENINLYEMIQEVNLLQHIPLRSASVINKLPPDLPLINTDVGYVCQIIKWIAMEIESNGLKDSSIEIVGFLEKQRVVIKFPCAISAHYQRSLENYSWDIIASREVIRKLGGQFWIDETGIHFTLPLAETS